MRSRDNTIGNLGESSYPMAPVENLGFTVPVLEAGTFASGASDPQVRAPAPAEFQKPDDAVAAEVFFPTNGAAGVEDKVVAVPSQPITVPGGAREGGALLRQKARQRAGVLIDQQIVLRSTDFPTVWSVRQRLEMSGGGSIVLEQTVDQTVDGLPTSTTPSTTPACPVSVVTKKTEEAPQPPFIRYVNT